MATVRVRATNEIITIFFAQRAKDVLGVDAFELAVNCSVITSPLHSKGLEKFGHVNCAKIRSLESAQWLSLLQPVRCTQRYVDDLSSSRPVTLFHRWFRQRTLLPARCCGILLFKCVRSATKRTKLQRKATSEEAVTNERRIKPNACKLLAF